MKTKLVITDLTRMYRGKVCIAGYDGSKRALRPVLPPPGIPEESLVQEGQAIIFPVAVVEFDLLEVHPKPAPTEDVNFDPESSSLLRIVQRKEKILQKIANPNRWLHTLPGSCAPARSIFASVWRGGGGNFLSAVNCRSTASTRFQIIWRVRLLPS